jgi:hypothetical protein
MAELQDDWKKSTAPDMVRLLTEHAVKYGLIVSSYVANNPIKQLFQKTLKHKYIVKQSYYSFILVFYYYV